MAFGRRGKRRDMIPGVHIVDEIDEHYSYSCNKSAQRAS